MRIRSVANAIAVSAMNGSALGAAGPKNGADRSASHTNTPSQPLASATEARSASRRTSAKSPWFGRYNVCCITRTTLGQQPKYVNDLANPLGSDHASV